MRKQSRRGPVRLRALALVTLVVAGASAGCGVEVSLSEPGGGAGKLDAFLPSGAPPADGEYVSLDDLRMDEVIHVSVGHINTVAGELPTLAYPAMFMIRQDADMAMFEAGFSQGGNELMRTGRTFRDNGKKLHRGRCETSCRIFDELPPEGERPSDRPGIAVIHRVTNGEHHFVEISLEEEPRYSRLRDEFFDAQADMREFLEAWCFPDSLVPSERVN